MNNSQFGFKEGDLETIIQTITRFPEISKAVIFGSRAKGNYKPGSDADIAVWATNINSVSHLSGVLNDETLLPYKFDILNYDQINNTELKDHINRIGIEIFKRK